MSQMRKNIITGEWVIVAGNRYKKPYAYKHSRTAKENCTTVCPFCVGNEEMTTEERYRVEENGAWQVRVFKNKYPAVDDEVFETSDDMFYTFEEGKGFHEVLVDTPVHGQEPHTFSTEKMCQVLRAISDRVELIKTMDGIKYVQVFKNNGPMAGASIAHSHWQIIGIPLVPMEQERSLISFEKYMKEKGKCLLCDMLEHEKEENVRIVYENDDFAVFIPYAAKFCFELYIVPKRHMKAFSDMTDSEFMSLADALKDTMHGVTLLREEISYNVCLQDAPKECGGEYHWYIRIIPRIGALAGFEHGTSCYINPMMPEDAARTMRENMKIVLEGK
ncbi:MAG: galactose-1-phosphate uridylyltransferase [Firmicutes bacterium]|nr:galactose-1-phosphate uridylyltransferase [Bacillota bacterium]